MIVHYFPHGGANPEWIRACSDMEHEPLAIVIASSQHEIDEGWMYADEARAEAYQRQERDRVERETGRPR
jgi:hypothetical protein